MNEVSSAIKIKASAAAKLSDVEWIQRWRRALFVATLFQWIPYLRYVGLNGSMATLEANSASDIDLYVAAKPGRIFIVRFATRALVRLLGMGRTSTRVAKQICLNRYGTLTSLQILPKDEYHAKVFSAQVPLYDSGMVHERFIAANHWWRQFEYTGVHKPAFLRPGLMRGIQVIFEILLWLIASPLENYLKALQLKRSAKAMQADNSLVQISDETLCFVERDWRTR